MKHLSIALGLVWLVACGLGITERQSLGPSISGDGTTEKPLTNFTDATVEIRTKGYTNSRDISGTINGVSFSLPNDELGYLDIQVAANEDTQIELNDPLPGGYACEVDQEEFPRVRINCSCQWDASSTKGSGDQEDPFQIWTFEDLNNLKNFTDQDRSKHYIQKCDLTYPSSFDPEPIPVFQGVYDGAAFEISGYTSKAQAPSKDFSKGLFSHLLNAEIKNISFKDASLIMANSSETGNQTFNVGAIAGTMTDSTLQNIQAHDVTIKVEKFNDIEGVGGLVGRVLHRPQASVPLKSIYVKDIDIDGAYAQHVGGIVGIAHTEQTLAELVEIDGLTIYGPHIIGGVAGSYSQGSNVTYGMYGLAIVNLDMRSFSYDDLNMSQEYVMGGLVGELDQGVIAQSYVQGRLTLNYGGISSQFTNQIGGFVGMINGPSKIENAFAWVEIDLDATLENVTAVKQSTSIGGFFGDIQGDFDIQNTTVNNPICEGCRHLQDLMPSSQIQAYDNKIKRTTSTTPYVLGQDIAMIEGAYPWDFSSQWCLQDRAPPSLRSLPSSKCK